jgi:hypothetical protein
MNGALVSFAYVVTDKGDIHAWNATQNAHSARWSHDTSGEMAVEFTPMARDGISTYLAASTVITMYSVVDQEVFDNKVVRPRKQMTFTGHASRIKSLAWEYTQEPRRFVSRAERDRFLNVWEIPTSGQKNTDCLLSSIALDDYVRHICLDPNAPSEQQLVLALSSSSATLYAMPLAKGVMQLRSNIRVLTPSTVRTELLSATFVPGDTQTLRIALLAGGLKVIVEDIVCSTQISRIVRNLRLPEVPR